MPASTPPGLTPEAIGLIAGADWITVFTGAGMSADSGVPTFREAQTGLWERFDATELATPEAWDDDPALVWTWYLWRSRLVRAAAPNPGHLAVAELGRDRMVMVVTQNVDDLHERAGSNVVSHLHGSLFEYRCSGCAATYPGPDAASVAELERHGSTAPDTATRIEPPRCEHCGAFVRPDIVWFGENLPADAWQRAESAITGADVVLVVGTSGIVYPAASLPERAAAQGIPVIEFNPEPTPLSSIATHAVRESASASLPRLVDAIRAGS